MSLQSHRELEATREKLRMLEERYEANKREQGGDEHVRELSMRSLKRLFNQLKPESLEESRSSGRPVAIGTTSTGRTILVVYEEIDEDTVYPVTAYDLEE